MNEKLQNLFHKYYDVLAYLVFGVLTTVVNYIIYLPCYNLAQLPAGAILGDCAIMVVSTFPIS